MRVVPALILLLLLRLFAWAMLVVVRRRRGLTEHPERRPYGKRLLLRASPFIAIGAASLVFGVVARQALYAVLGIVILASFGYEISHRWTPPDQAETRDTP